MSEKTLLPGYFGGGKVRYLRALISTVLLLLAGVAHGQVTGQILDFEITNYTAWIIAGDTNVGGRQAIQTSTGMFFTNTSSTEETYDFKMVYQLVNQTTGAPVPILDQNGLSNITYDVFQTNTLPFFEVIGIDPPRFIEIYSLDLTNNAPLQPLARLNPYDSYEMTLAVYSRTNGPGAYIYTGQSNYQSGYVFYDFTNTASPDPSANFLITTYPSLNSTFAISNSPGEGGYPVSVELLVQRYDDFTLPPYPTNTTITVNFELLNATTGVPVPLQSNEAQLNVTLESHDTNTPPDPVYIFTNVNFSIVPAAPLDSVDDQYTVVITQTHTEGLNTISDNTNSIGPQQLLYFNSELFFGPLLTYFTNINGTPTITNTVANSHLDVLLAVSTNAGYFPGAPGHFYGNGSNIAVSLSTDGTATLLGGQSVTVQGPPVDLGAISNVLFARGGITLTSNGATGTLTVGFPVGFTTAFPTNAVRWSVSAFVAANLALNQNLDPASNIVTYPFTVYGIQENLPVWFSVPAIQWVVNSGEFIMSPTSALFVRQLEDDLLTANTSLLANPNAARRVSNDAYYRNVNVQPGSQLIVAADSNGIARVSCQLALSPPELRPHFPYSGDANGQEIQTASGGMLIISNGVISSNSFLPVSAPVPISYERTCGDTNCSPQMGAPATLAFTPTNNQLQFNADGGLLAYGSVPPTNLTWGYDGGNHYAQEAYTIQDGAYEMAGTFLLGGQSALDPTELAAGLLLSGFGDGGTNESYVERPGDSNYDSGFANYAGLNVRAPPMGNSYIAEESTGEYPLDARSKYYARYAGVSGIHESASFPSSLTLYGYEFTFTTYRLSFLDSDVDESRTDGAISFPTEPSGFMQEFQDMKFSCTGDLESAEVPPDSGVKHMSYWNVNITPESIQFQPGTNDPCGTGNRWLVLGVETTLPFIPQKLQASLGFQPNGNLVTPADGVEGTDSRFPIPGQLSLQGPGGDIYPLSTCAEGYFNNYETAGKPPSGFYNIAGRLRVPFFDDIKVHLHVMPTGTNTAQISIMGGWPFAGTSAPDLGWSVNNSNYFNEAVFDSHSDGFPTSAGINDYESSPNTMYRPVAQRDWIEVAIFDYPLQFNPVTREFAGFQDAPVDLPIIDVNSRLKEISPGKVDFDFDQDVTLQLPVIKSLDFLNDASNEVDEALTSVSNAVESSLGTAFTTAGLNGLQYILREDPTTFFQPVLNNAFSTSENELFTELAALPETNKDEFLSNVVYLVNHSTLTASLANINGAAGSPNTLIGQVDNTLSLAQNDVGVMLKVLGSQNAVGSIISQLTSDEGPALGFAASLGGSELDSLVGGIGPTLSGLQGQFQNLNNQLAQAQKSLRSASGDFNQALGQALDDSTGASQFVQMAANNLSNRLASAITPAGDFFSADPGGAQTAIQQEIQNAFFSSQLPTDYQQTLRQFLFDDNAALDTLLDTFFDQIDGAIRDGLSDLITDTLDNTLEPVKGLASGTFLSAKIRGEPTFDGDSMTKIHLNAAVQLNVPTAMNFNAYMEILELDSMTTPMDCIPAGPPAAEVTIGANNVQLDWPGLNPTGTPLTLTVQAKWTIQDGNVIGVGGLFDIKGEVGFQGCSVNEIGASLAFGEEENYFAAKVAGTITILGVPVDVQAGVFVGKACSLAPILFIDPDATNVLSLPPGEFAGIYLEFGASLSLSQILFGESSCFLDIGVSESSAVYYDGGPESQQIGMRQTMGIDASLLCLLSASASLTMFGTTTVTPSGVTLEIGGEAQICGSIGPCPFCISGCEGITVTGEVGTGGISYHVDY